jgi:hypothetical protein
MRAALATMLL